MPAEVRDLLVEGLARRHPDGRIPVALAEALAAYGAPPAQPQTQSPMAGQPVTATPIPQMQPQQGAAVQGPLEQAVNAHLQGQRLSQAGLNMLSTQASGVAQPALSKEEEIRQAHALMDVLYRQMAPIRG